MKRQPTPEDDHKAMPDQSVARRRVFYVPGFDPFPPRRYRELYRKESAKQADISGYRIAQSPNPAADGFGWRVQGDIGGPVTADIDVLVWSDIVGASMGRSIAATYWQMVRTAWTYTASGTLRRVMWLRKGPVIAALYPLGVLIAQFAVAIALLFLVHALWAMAAASVLPARTGHLFQFLSGVGWVLGAVAAIYALRWFKSHDGKVFAHYLMHDYAFTAQNGGAYPLELETRLAQFADRVAEALASDVDEVLVVGHSSGAYLAVSILADLIRQGRVPAVGPDLALLTLGQVIPMASFLPKAQRLRRDLHDVAASDQLMWVDVSAPGDGCAFALCDPVAVSGVDPDTKHGPLVVSAAFTQTLAPDTWAQLRWRFFRLHFQYLCAFDRPGDYDYFQVTAGPLTLAERYAGRAPSRQRIDVLASKYTDMGA